MGEKRYKGIQILIIGLFLALSLIGIEGFATSYNRSKVDLKAVVLTDNMKLEIPDTVFVGDKGSFDISVEYEDILFEGKYVFEYDSSLIHIDDQGNWEALKDGEVKIAYGYRPSEKMLKSIENQQGSIDIKGQGDKEYTMTIEKAPLVKGMAVKGAETVAVGDKGTLDVTVDYDGMIPFDGKYVFRYDETLLKIDAHGNWEALKNGEAKIAYGYYPSEEMLTAIEKTYGSEDIQEGIGKEHTMVIEKIQKEYFFVKGMTLNGAKTVTVGDKGTFDIQVDYDGTIPYDGEYVFYYDESLIKVDAHGNWEALKNGEVKITYGYRPSEKMLAAIEVAYGPEVIIEEIGKEHTMVIEQAQKEYFFVKGMTLNGAKTVTVGDKGTFDIQVDYDGTIPYDGEYVFRYDETLLKIDDKGNWEALKNGEAKITYGYRPSEKMLAAIEVAYGPEVIIEEIGKEHTMMIEQASENYFFVKGMTLNGAKTVTVGDKGTFDIQVDYDGTIPYDGEYVFYYDESLIKIDSNGNWEALKTGEVMISYGYRPSEKMLAAIEAVYGPEVIHEEIGKMHTMVILDRTNLGEEKPSGATINNATKDTTLPKTGEVEESYFNMGIISLVSLCVICLFRSSWRKTLKTYAN